MEPFSTNQVVGIVLIGTAIIDMYVLPKVLLKNFSQDPGPTATPQQKADLEKKRKAMKLIIMIVTSVTALLGLLFFIGVIPIHAN